MSSTPTDKLPRLRAAARAAAAGNPAVASELYGGLVRDFPADPDVLTPAGEFLCRGGRGDMATRIFHAAFARAGRTTPLLVAYSAMLMAAGRFEDAVKAAGMAVEQSPDDVASWTTLGRGRLMIQQVAGAEEAFHRAVQLNPTDPGGPLGLAWCAASRGDRRAAVAHYRDALIYDPANVGALCDLARNLRAIGELDEAGRAIARAAQQAPTAPQVIVARAEHLILTGDVPAAARLLQPLIEARSLPPDAVRLLPEVAEEAGGPAAALAEVERLMADPACPPQTRTAFEPYRGALLEQLGEHERAFASYAAAHAAAPVAFDPARARNSFERIRAVFSAENLVRLPRATQLDDRPIFVIGMPRSGTTLVEQTISAHSQVFGAGELTLIPDLVRELPSIVERLEPYPDCATALTSAHADALSARLRTRLAELSAGSPRVTDKYPHNFLHLGLIQSLLPGARVVHCRRDPLDNCLSIFATPLSGAHAYRQRLDWLGAYYRLYHDLMNHWTAVLNLPILTVEYESFVADPPLQTRRMLDFLGLPWEDGCLRPHESNRPVLTASRTQVRQAVYDSSIGRAARFGPLLDPLRTALGNLAKPAPATPPVGS